MVIARLREVNFMARKASAEVTAAVDQVRLQGYFTTDNYSLLRSVANYCRRHGTPVAVRRDTVLRDPGTQDPDIAEMLNSSFPKRIR